jgi:DNA polymerase V
MPSSVTYRSPSLIVRWEIHRRIRPRILRWIGIPCCLGIGPTKTLAKLGNNTAKNAERKAGSYPPEPAQVCRLRMMPPD